jgi:hypothetical protein
MTLLAFLLFITGTGLAFYHLRRIPSAEEQNRQVTRYLAARRAEEAAQAWRDVTLKVHELKDAFRLLAQAADKASEQINQSMFKAVN